MTDTFTLDVAQATEIKHAAIRAGITNADLKALSSGDMFARILPILRRYGEVVVRSMFTPVGIFTYPKYPQARFHTSFKVDISEGASLKIYSIDDNFREWFPWGKTESEVRGETKLVVSQLKEHGDDRRIRNELGDKRLTSLHEFHSIIKRQGNGEDGLLALGIEANIFYILDRNEEERAVFAIWNHVGGWSINARRIDHSAGWYACNRVVSRG